MKTVFVAMSADIFHTGHLNIIQIARELGEVIIGLGTDELNASRKQMAFMSYEQRKAILENIKGVTQVIPQPTLDLVPNLRALKPDYVVHGDDWKTGFLRETRQRVIDVLREWDGQLIEPPYTPGVSSTNLRAAIYAANQTPVARSRQLQRLLRYKPFVRFIEVHNGLSAAVAQRAQTPNGKQPLEFDALWLSPESEAFARGISAPENLDFSARLPTIQDILHCTHKPLVVDLGGAVVLGQVAYQVSQLERAGVSGVVIAQAETAVPFAHYLQKGREAVAGQQFALIASLGYLTAQTKMEPLLQMAQTALDNGADALLLGVTLAALTYLNQFVAQYAMTSERLPLIVQLKDFTGGDTAL
ncbi:MAG: isocitrate lyase/phosphoenolpyruvate mutase family protein, partial [Anaerolineales bacterium]|nr:isocitrate lyase/phosphoenolpyruvate mutase family protein [Anaerolineales bacterium]